ncbi:MAG TPA: TRIC cation channel family protein [Terriglobales bacterium]|nr:TRIC cation channel family protein [Terriglobales bacterium]
MGTITGVGGGVIRDVFLAQIPLILRSDIYATAALAGSVIMLVFCRLGVSRTRATFVGAFVCFMLRVVSVWRHWNLPKVMA